MQKRPKSVKSQKKSCYYFWYNIPETQLLSTWTWCFFYEIEMHCKGSETYKWDLSVTSHHYLQYHCHNYKNDQTRIVRNRNERTPSRESANYKDSNTTLHKSSISGTQVYHYYIRCILARSSLAPSLSVSSTSKSSSSQHIGEKSIL